MPFPRGGITGAGVGQVPWGVGVGPAGWHRANTSQACLPESRVRVVSWAPLSRSAASEWPRRSTASCCGRPACSGGTRSSAVLAPAVGMLAAGPLAAGPGRCGAARRKGRPWAGRGARGSFPVRYTARTALLRRHAVRIQDARTGTGGRAGYAGPNGHIATGSGPGVTLVGSVHDGGAQANGAALRRKPAMTGAAGWPRRCGSPGARSPARARSTSSASTRNSTPGC